MIAMREHWPFLPEVRLYHDQEKAGTYIREHWDVTPVFLEAGAQTWYSDGAAVVLMSHSGKRVTEDALLTHEAYHVFSLHMDYLGEDDPGEEIMAYGVQTVSKALMRAQRRWRRRNG